MAEVSIIVPVYNVELYLQRCVDSLLKQSFSEFELILIDDGSTDKSGEICDAYASIDKRIKVIHQKNSGVSVARNAGITAAQGTYLTFIDSDDYVEKEYLSSLYTLVKQYNADLSIVSLFAFDENSDRLYDLSEEVYHSGKEAVLAIGTQYNYKFRTCCAKLVRKKIAETNPFPVDQKSGEDFATAYRWIFAADCVVNKNIPLYHYNRENEESLTHSFRLKNLDELHVEEMLSFFEKNQMTELVKIYAEEYIMRSAIYINNVQDSMPKEKLLLGSLRRTLRTAIKKYGEIIKLNQLSQKNYIMRTAYPKRYKIKQAAKRIKRRIKIHTT